jgi:2-dehydro-3-deoxyphosphogluconate aldolase / (4S)-4-hydroxy-2-oxoglutarate aldolase
MSGDTAAKSEFLDLSAELARFRVIPVIVLDDVAQAAPLGAALVAGGLPVAEVTFRTPVAEQCVREMASDPGLLVGAGTIVTAEQVDRAVAAGARFLVSPGLSPSVVRRADEHGVPVLPGVATPTEIIAALDLGIDVVKLFPAAQLGGVRTVRALAAPFPELRFVPTGGVTADLLPDYLAIPAVLAVGGSWMVAPDLLSAGNFSAITARVAEAAAIAAGAR